MTTDQRLIQDWTPDSLNNPQGYSPGAAQYIKVPDDYFEKPLRQSYPVPKDTTSVYMQPPLDAASMFVVNMSQQVVTIRQPDTGEYYCAGGATSVIPLRKGIAGGQFQAFLQGAYTGNGLVEIWFDKTFYPPLATFSSAIAPAVTISGQPISVNFPVAQPITINGQPIEVHTNAGDIAAGSAVAGAFVDGSIATIGTTTDAALTGANGSVVSQLKGLFTRLVSAAADGVATTIGMLQIGGFNGATIDRLRTLIPNATSTLTGVLLTSGAVDGVTTSATAAQAAAGFSLISARPASGAKRRTIYYANNLNATATVNVLMAAITGGLFLTVLQFTVAAGANGAINSAGASSNVGAAPTLLNASSFSVLDSAVGNVISITVNATGATTGSFQLDLAQVW